MGRIVCFGDSNTYGYDPRSYFGSQYPPDIRWTGLLQSSGWEVVNCGQNGRLIPQEMEFPHLDALFRRLQPYDFVAVMLGSNNILGGDSAAQAAERMGKFLRCLENCTGGAKGILIAPPPMKFGDWVQTQERIDESIRLAEAYQALAQKHHLAFGDAGKWNIELAFDGVHFSAEGHAAFAANFIRLLDSLQQAEQKAGT